MDRNEYEWRTSARGVKTMVAILTVTIAILLFQIYGCAPKTPVIRYIPPEAETGK